MKKRTRMIVLTKGHLAIYLCLFALIVLCTTILFSVSEPKHKQAFSGYENIISRQLIPKEKKRKKIGTGLLEHIFKYEIKEQPTKAPIPKEEKKENIPILESEKITVKNELEIRNATNIPVSLSEYASRPLSCSKKANILIVHTHTTESFAEKQYIKDAPDRNLDERYNMIAVGKAIKETFDKNGIKSIHDTTVHDYPSYNSSYQKACATIEKNLKNDPTINIVLDIHRDGITREDGTKVKLVTDVNGIETAQIMLVVGTNTNLQHDNWKENLTLASHIQSKAMEMYPGLMRAVDLRKERFNQQLTQGSLIIEIGANGNTLEEAIEGGKAIAQVISEVVK